MVNEYKFYSQDLEKRDQVGELSIKSATMQKRIHKERDVGS
jgi:hypothetical protein